MGDTGRLVDVEHAFDVQLTSSVIATLALSLTIPFSIIADVLLGFQRVCGLMLPHLNTSSRS